MKIDGDGSEFFKPAQNTDHRSIYPNQRLVCPYCSSSLVTATKYSIGASYYKCNNCSNEFSVIL